MSYGDRNTRFFHRMVNARRTDKDGGLIIGQGGEYSSACPIFMPICLGRKEAKDLGLMAWS